MFDFILFYNILVNVIEFYQIIYCKIKGDKL